MPSRRVFSWQILSYVPSSILPGAVYLLFLGVATVFAATHPMNGWDMLGYIGVIESWHTSDSKAIHDAVYSAIRSVPEHDELVGKSTCKPEAYTPYRADVASNSENFSQQLPFYSIKPLYLLTAFALHRIGFSYPRSFLLVSVMGYCGLGIIAWTWISRYWASWPAMVFSGLLMINPELVSVARSTSPDALALLFLAFGLYVLLEFPSSICGPIFLLVTIWVRPDALVLVGLLLATSLLLRFKAGGEGKRPDVVGNLEYFWIRMKGGWDWATLCVLAVLSYLAIQFTARPYSWNTLFYHSFINLLSRPAEISVKITPLMYMHTLAANLRSLLGNSPLALLLLMGTLGVILHTLRHYRWVTACIMASVLVHFLLYPSDNFRFHVPATFFIQVSVLIACAMYRERSSIRDMPTQQAVLLT